MWTVGSNDLFHYAASNIRGTASSTAMPNFYCFSPSFWRIGLQFLQNDYYLPFWRNQQLESTVCDELLCLGCCIHLQYVFFSKAANQILKQKMSSFYSLSDTSCKSAKVESTYRPG